MRINKHDTNGIKSLLGKGELGYDDYAAGGDGGRVYVGTGSENIALAEKLEASMMTKAQFNALAEERKANRGGSGFDELGKHHATVATYHNINEGMYTYPNVPNIFNLGRQSSTGTGVSKTELPILNVNGIRHILKSLGTGSSYENTILLPTAPNIYPHDTVLTTEQINSGVIKHADSSNSGLIVNGKFDIDTSGWTNGSTGTATMTYSSGRVLITGTDSSNRGAILQVVPTIVVGKKYIAEVDVEIVSGSAYLFGESVGASGLLAVKGKNRYEFVATTTTLVFYTASGSGSIYIDNIVVYPADAISRSDLVFLESWHEDVSEKNFVYPLGNVQYLGGNTDGLTGIANGTFTGFETYSLFGNWQTSSALIGKGYVWSNLTEAQKRAFIANPENNCYLDGDKTIQVRYRVRVVQGLGDSWKGIDTQITTYMSYIDVGGNFVAAKGKAVSLPSDFRVSNTNVYLPQKSPEAKIKESGIFEMRTIEDVSGFAYEGKCFALPIALVHRRNQGMYHPVYNPNGSKKASDGNFWYNTAVSFTSISDCFDPTKLLTASGYIGSVSGRPDGLFYDQVHEGDILDLRSSSKKVEDYNRLISREFNKLVAGTTRGKEGEPLNLPYYTQGTVIRGGTAYGISRYQCGEGSIIVAQSNGYFGSTTLYSSLNGFRFLAYITIDGIRDLYVMCQIPGYSASVTNRAIRKLHETAYYAGSSDLVDIAYIGMIPVKNETNVSSENAGNPLFFGSKSTRTKSNTLLHCDIIGNPSNYPTSWKQSGVFGTPLIVAEDGTSLLPDGAKDTFKLSRKANATPLLCLRSTDSGLTWTSFTPTFSTTTNEITLTNEPATNLVVIYYQTHTIMAAPVANSEVLEIGDVYASCHNNKAVGNDLFQTLLSKSGINTGDVTFINSIKVPNTTISNSGKTLFATSNAYNNTHSSILLQTSPVAYKVFPYLTRLNGKAYLNLVFKEMKHNGTSWGDDNKFNIVDNVSTTTDNNAQTVLIGQKTVELPYFIGAYE